MKRLRALKEIASIVGPIYPGVDFYETNPDLEAQYLRTGHAADLSAAPVPGAPPVWIPDTPNDWTGCEVVIVASGPSLTIEQCNAAMEWASVSAQRKVIAINTSFRLAPFADVIYACDGHYWTTQDPTTGQTYFDEMISLGIERQQMWTQDKGTGRTTARKLGINCTESEAGQGLNKKKNVINQGANSGFQSIGLSVKWGARKIYLLGFDCKGTHWHGNHPPPINAMLPHKMWLDAFAKLAPDLVAAGVEVVNCSPDSSLKVFPQKRWEEVLCSQSASSVPRQPIGAMLSSTA